MERTLRLLSFMASLLLVSSGVYAQECKELTINGDFEGSDLSCFFLNISDEGIRNLGTSDIVVDNNDENNHCAQISFTKGGSSQFIIKFTEPPVVGDLFEFSIRAKSQLGNMARLRSEELGDISISTEWNTYTVKGVVDAQLREFPTITFNLTNRKSDIFYFDNISFKVRNGSTPIEFADAKVKEICVNKWDVDGNGELSIGEAALVKELGYMTFANQDITSFDELQYFTGLTAISGDFYGCAQLKSIIIPENVTTIGGGNGWMYAFGWCRNLTSVTLGEKVYSIGNSAFIGCESLSSINFPNSLGGIEAFAFQNCISLQALNISKNLQSIDDYAFYGCSGLTSIVVEEGNKYYDSRENCNALIRKKDNTLMVGSSNAFIPNSVTTIAEYAFSGRSGLTSLTIPKNVIKIGNNAFSGCGGLNSITVEEGNLYYDSRNNCNALILTATNLLIRGCNNTIIPNDITTIGANAFSGSNNLTAIKIPRSVTSIEEYAFQNCTGPNLIAIQVEEGNPTYDSRNNCNALIETAADSLIIGCNNTIIPVDVKEIGPYAFTGCSNITSIIIPNNVRTIGAYAFMDCSGLSSVVIGNSVEKIESWAFRNCTNLLNYYCYAEQVPDARGLYGNTALHYEIIENATLHVPATSIDAYSADNCWKNFGNIVALTDNDPKPTGIMSVTNDKMNGECYYSIDGKQITKPQRGLNIIRMKDGTTRKVLVK